MDALKPVLILLSGMAGAALGFLLTASAIIFGFMAILGPEERADPFGGAGGIVLLGVLVGTIATPLAGLQACRSSYWHFRDSLADQTNAT
jgi:hypothetical protein